MFDDCNDNTSVIIIFNVILKNQLDQIVDTYIPDFLNRLGNFKQ